MPESTCLHIQDRESGPIRVVELPWISVRIGRAAYCEVRLTGEDLAEETCRLTRRGRTWSLTPIGGRRLVVLEGRTVQGPCPLPFDVPFQIGCYCLTLRHDVGAEPDWEIYPAIVHPRAATPVSFSPLEITHVAEGDHDRSVVGPTPDFEPAGNASRPGRDRSRWQARWKAAEAQLKSRTAGFQAASEGPGIPSPSPSPFEAVPSPERPYAVPRPSAASAPLIDPISRPIPTPRVPRLEPSWSPPQPEQPLAEAPPGGLSQHPLDRIARPVPNSAAVRFEPTWTGPPEPSPGLPVAPSPTSTDWIARERPMVPAAGRRLAEPIRPVAPRYDAGPPEESSTATGLDTASGESPRDAGELGNSEFEVRDSGFAIPDSGFQIEEVGEVRSASTDQVGEVRPPILESETGNPESDGGTTGSGPELLGAGLEPDPEPGGLRKVDERAVIESRESLAKPGGGDRVRDRREATLSRERSDDPFRPLVREPRNRRTDRARAGSEHRGEGGRGIRANDTTSGLDSSRHGATARADDVVWPSVKDILANHRASPGPKPAVMRTRQGAQPLPTVPREPGQWLLPVWLAWPPLAGVVLLAGLGTCVLSWFWVVDASSAAIVMQRLMAPDGVGRRKPLPASVVMPDGRWPTTTAQHLAHWAIFLRGAEADPDRSVPEALSMLDRALQISPLNPTARLALAQVDPPGSRTPASLRALGLSRDAVSLAWSARQLLGGGRKDASLRLYEQALTVASANGLSRSATPRFNDDLAAQRYLLPGEDAVRDIVAEMDSQGDWTFREWSKALPQNPTVLLATARLFREQGRDEAQPLLELILNLGESPLPGGGADPCALAARAEALAMGLRLKDAEQEYRRAIELVENDVIRRSWWFNLADIARRLNDDSQQQAALRAAGAVATNDDISRRVILIRRAADSLAPVSIPSAKAN